MTKPIKTEKVECAHCGKVGQPFNPNTDSWKSYDGELYCGTDCLPDDVEVRE